MVPYRPRRALLPAFALGAMALAIGAPTASAGASVPGCASFESQAAAQSYFALQGGSRKKPVGELDDDRDGVACEGLPGPYKGFATIAYNEKKAFFYGAVSMPPAVAGDEVFPCLYGNRHFAEGPRLLTVFKVQAGADRPIAEEVGAAAAPSSGRLVWKAERPVVGAGRYYAAFEERVPLTPYGPNECPGFRSAEIGLP